MGRNSWNGSRYSLDDCHVSSSPSSINRRRRLLPQVCLHSHFEYIFKLLLSRTNLSIGGLPRGHPPTPLTVCSSSSFLGHHTHPFITLTRLSDSPVHHTHLVIIHSWSSDSPIHHTHSVIILSWSSDSPIHQTLLVTKILNAH